MILFYQNPDNALISVCTGLTKNCRCINLVRGQIRKVEYIRKIITAAPAAAVLACDPL